MASSDIYGTKENPWANRTEAQPTSQRTKRHGSSKTFEQAVNPDLSRTHRRRSRNSGFRRFIHLMKKPEFSKKFWTILLGVSGLILILLIIWDFFFRYPKPKSDYSRDVYQSVVD